MATVFCENQSVECKPDGVIVWTMRATIMDPETSRVEQTDVGVVFDSAGEVDAINQAVFNAVQGKASELGFNVNQGDVLVPALMKI